ncbi:MAG: hypothetical protein ABL997_01290 [Planctomycetota bacterium]
MEPLFEFLFEVVLQIVFEILFELGLRSAKHADRTPSNPWLAALGYALVGAIAGGISCLLFPALFLSSSWARYANLLLTPIAAGAVMATLGAWRMRKEQRVLRIDRFAYAYLFALAMAVVRVAVCR